MDHAEDCIGPHEVPRINRRAIMGWIALKLQRIDRGDAAICSVGSAPIELRLVEIDAFIELSCGAVRLIRVATAARDAIPRRGGARYRS